MSLNARQQAFIDEYLICLNASEAARKSGYNGKSNVEGSRLLANANIRAEIDRRQKEKHLDADSVLARMSEMANSDIVTFADVRRISDLKNPQYKGRTHVIKKFKSKITRDALGREIEEIELELYGADSMLDKMARHHGLYNDKVQLTDWRSELVDLFRQGKITKEDLLNEFADQPETAFEFFESFGLSPDEGRQAQVDSGKQTTDLAD